MTCKYTQLSNFLCKFRKRYPPLHKNRFYCLCILCTVHQCFVFSLLTSRNPNKISEHTKINFRSLEGINWKRPTLLCCRLIWLYLPYSSPPYHPPSNHSTFLTSALLFLLSVYWIQSAYPSRRGWRTAVQQIRR
jgi:hypothetical protein